MKDKDIIWYGKRKCSQEARKTGNLDISITESFANNVHKARFIFRNGVSNILSETDYIQYGITKNKRNPRVYFMSGTSDSGLKMSITKSSRADNRYVTINRESDAAELLPFTGDYELLYDSECSRYYIQK